MTAKTCELSDCWTANRSFGGCWQRPLPPFALRYAEHVERSGTALFQRVRELDLEGLVAKQKFGPYVTDRDSSISIGNTRRHRDVRNYSIATGTANLFPAGTRASWRALVSKAKLSQCQFTAKS